MTYTRLIRPGAEPYLFSRGPQACLIVHGFNSSTRENREMGQWLADQGFTVLGIRLPGRATTHKVTYNYDSDSVTFGKGRRTSMSDGSGETS